MLVSRRIMVAKFPYFLWALRLALIVLCAFIAFVSLMPFNWTFDALTGQAVAVFFDINPFQPHTGRVGLALDAGLNALLFAPLGFGLWVNDRRAPMRVLGLGRMLVLAVVYGTAPAGPATFSAAPERSPVRCGMERGWAPRRCGHGLAAVESLA